MARASKTVRKPPRKPPAKPKAKAKPKRLNHKAAFLAAYVETGGHIGKSAKAVGIRRELHSRWLKEDPAYRDRFETETYPDALDTLSDEAIRRAYHGTRRTIYYKGEPIGVEFTYSDNLLMFLLGRRDPRFREKASIEHSGPNGGPIDIAARILAGLERVRAGESEAGNGSSEA